MIVPRLVEMAVVPAQKSLVPAKLTAILFAGTVVVLEEKILSTVL
jgi:hypothetical protein